MKSNATFVTAFAVLSASSLSWAQSPPGPSSAAPTPKPAASAAATAGPAAAAESKKSTPTTPATPAAAASVAVPGLKETAPAAASPAVVVVTQPTAPAPAAPEPVNNWGAGVLGLLILGVGGYYGLRYAQKRGVTVADSLQKLGVEMPQDGMNGPGSISHLKPPPPQAAPLPPLPSLSNLPEAAVVGSGIAAATAAPARSTGVGNFVGTLGPVEGKRLSVPVDGPLTMGRDTDNTLPLPDDTTVSRRHARIEAASEGNGFQIVDEGSSNGTYVNGQRLPAGNSRTLVVGDEIQIGASRLRFEG